jgi:spectinomycin phosphotransferase
MREPLVGISADALIHCLRAHYRLDVIGFEFLALGADVSAWVYRVRSADGSLHFLKVRTGITNEASLIVPRVLADRGLTHVIAPLRTNTGDLWAQAGDYTLTVYPFVDGRTAKEQRMSDQQWIDYGTLLRQVHSTTISPDLARVLKRDPLTPVWTSRVRAVDAHLGSRTLEDPAQRALAAFWQERREDILSLLTRIENLGQRLSASAPEFVLCHADIHQANVLLDASQRVWFTDWDDVMLAPRECDLIMAIGGIIPGLVGPHEEALFLQGYGPLTIDPVALSYFRHCRAVSDIDYVAEQIFFRPDLGASFRRGAVDNFKRMFAPGHTVPLALAST